MAFSLFKKIAGKQEDNAPKDKVTNKYLDLKVYEVVQETPDAISIVFETSDVQYKPGQFFTLIPTIKGKEVRRAYSVCTSPFTDKYPAVTIKRVEGGLVSNYLNDNIKAGDTLKVMEPMGAFTTEVNEADKRHVVLFGGGSGITPLISIAKSVLFKEPNSQVSLIYANRNEQSIIFKATLAELEKNYSGRFNVIHVLDQAPLNWTGPTGLLQPALLKQLVGQLPTGAYDKTEYFMCGPEGMMKNVEDTLADLNIPKEFVHKESFVAGKTEKNTEEIASGEGGVGEELKAREVTVIFDGEEHKFMVEPNKTILETALELDIDLPYSCQSGLCTACRGKCISGKVSLDEDEGLSDQEKEDGYVLTCVGHPVTDDVVIEIG